MFDIERFRVLLKGDDVPKSQEEQQWLDNYRENQCLSAKKRQEEQEQYYRDRDNAYREVYALIKSSIPSSFFVKKPISSDEYNLFVEKIESNLTKKIFFILSNSITRALYKLPQKLPYGDDYGPALFLEEKFLYAELSKKYGYDFEKLYQQYESFLTDDFVSKIDKIRDKYKVYIDYSFSPYWYLTDWQDYNV